MLKKSFALASASLALAAAFGVTSAFAAPLTCTKNGETRILETIAPGEVGAACDLKYTRNNGAIVSVPFHANSDANFCATKAQEIAGTLVEAGYSCSEGAPSPVAAVSEPAPVQAEVTTAAAPVAVEPAPPKTEPAEVVAEARPEVPVAPDEVAPRTATVAAAPVANEPLTEKVATLETPAPVAETVEQVTVASNGPAALAPSTVSAEKIETQPAAARGAAVGRITGATPIDSPKVEERLEIVEAPKPKPVADTPPARAVVAPVAVKASTGSTSRMRTQSDIIRATLAAQTAAWNEGDIAAFMEGYWKSDELRFVSGSDVTKGWTTTLKRYRARYGDGAALGNLSFDNLRVQMVTEDVAIIVGRFDLVRAAGDDSGIFTLVMRRIDGGWRIVHDHTVADAAATE